MFILVTFLVATHMCLNVKSLKTSENIFCAKIYGSINSYAQNGGN